MSSWNDDRLNELSAQTDAGFREMREGFARVDKEFKDIKQEMSALTSTLLRGSIGVIVAILGHGIFG